MTESPHAAGQAPDEGRQGREPGTAELEAEVEAPRSRIVRLGTTFAAFRHRDYSLFWSGALVSNTGSWMQMYAMSIVVYALRRSELDLGIVNLMSGLPVFFLALPAGVLADRLDRRKLLIWAQAALMVEAAVLGLLYSMGLLSDRSPVAALVYICSLGLFAGIMSALTFPAWQSTVPDILPRKHLLNGIALNAAQFQSARLLGPLAAAGLVFLGAGMADIFYVNAVSFIFVIGALALMRFEFAGDHPPHPRGEGAWKTLTAGLSYAREDRVVGLLILSVAMMTVFGMPYMILLPALVDKALIPAGLAKVLHDTTLQRFVSYVMAANGFGAVLGALAVARLRRSRREPLVRWSLGAMALLLVAFALSRSLALTMVVSALTGAAFLISTSLINTSIQMCVPQQLRGRVMALFVMGFMGIMPLSAAVFGPLGQAAGPDRAVIAGAVVLLAYVLFLFARPGLLEREGDCAEG